MQNCTRVKQGMATLYTPCIKLLQRTEKCVCITIFYTEIWTKNAIVFFTSVWSETSEKTCTKYVPSTECLFCILYLYCLFAAVKNVARRNVEK